MRLGRFDLRRLIGIASVRRAVLMVVVVLATSLCAQALAQTREPSADEIEQRRDDPQLRERQAERQAERERRKAQRATPGARAERARSRRAYSGESDDDAFETGRRVHGKVLDAPVARPLASRPGERIKKYLSDHSAIVDLGDDKPNAYVETTLPLLVDGEPFSLSLEDTGGALKPKNAPTQLRIGKKSSDGVTLASGINFRPAEARTKPSRVVADKAFYANVLGDIDYLVEPRPDGAQAMFVLRSEDSTEAPAIDFDLPAGARLALDDQREGAVDIVRDGKVIASIEPPLAWDADEEQVSVRYAVKGSRLVVHVPHRSADAHYPILVDPTVIDDQMRFDTYPMKDWTGWYTATAPGCPFYEYNPDSTAGARWGNGLYHVAWTTLNFGAGCWTDWRFNAVRPGANIFRTDFIRSHQPANNSHELVGIWRPNGGGWDGEWHTPGGIPSAAPFDSPWAADENYITTCAAGIYGSCAVTAGQGGNWIVYGLNLPSGAFPMSADAAAAATGAAVYQYDLQDPAIFRAGDTVPTQWVQNAAFSISVEGYDPGLGISRVALSGPGIPGPGAPNSGDVQEPCAGNSGNRARRCDERVPKTFNYGTTGMPEGENTLTAYADDIILRPRAHTFYTVRVDRSDPTVALSGALWEARGTVLQQSTSALTVTATDGSAGASTSRSGVKSIEILTKRSDESSFTRRFFENQTCGTNCPMTRGWTFDRTQFADGDYTIKVAVTDNVNRVSERTFPVTVVAPPANETSPTLIGTARDREILTADTGTWSGAGPLEFSYQWEACAPDGSGCAGLEGETEPTIELRSQDVGKRIRVSVTARNRGGAGTAQSVATDVVAALAPSVDGAPDIAGYALTNETLHATVGFWVGSRPFQHSFQWYRCPSLTAALPEECVPITGATNSDYTVTALDMSSRLRVEVGAENQAGGASQFSEPTPEVGTDLKSLTELPGEIPTEDPTNNLSDQVDDAVQFRSDFGLSTDRTLVEQLEADPAYKDSRDMYGVSLRPDEARLYEIRDRWLDEIRTVEDYGREEAPNSYGGSYVDQNQGGVIYVGFTADRVAHQEALKQRFPFPTKLRFFDATRTIEELSAVQDAVEADADTLGSQGVNVLSVDIDAATSAVVVGVPSPTDAIQQDLRNRYGSSITVTQEDPPGKLQGSGSDPGATAASGRRRYTKQDARGGLTINDADNHGNSQCSSGFVGVVTSTNSNQQVDVVMTAGHCSPSYQYFYPIGPVPTSPDGGMLAGVRNQQFWRQGASDLGQTDAFINSARQPNESPYEGRKWVSDVVPIVINRRTGKPLVYKDSDEDFRVVDTDDQASNDDDRVKRQQRVCVSFGRGDMKWKCGLVKSTRFIEPSGSDSFGHYNRAYGSRVTSINCRGMEGVSGSPVFEIGRDNHIRAVGMITAATSPARADRPRKCVYTHIRNIKTDTTFRPIEGSGSLR